MDSEKLLIEYVIKNLEELQKKGNMLYTEASLNNYVYFSGYALGRIGLILETLKQGLMQDGAVTPETEDLAKTVEAIKNYKPIYA